jgi:DedD protein
MAEKKSGERADKAVIDESDMRNMLAKRLAVAGGLVAILLGMLGLFDHFSQPSDEEELPVFTRPVPVVPKKMLTQPVTPAEIEPEPTPAALPAAEPKTSSAVAPSAAELPPPPVVSAAPDTEPARQATSVARVPARLAPSEAAAPKAEPTALPEKTVAPPSSQSSTVRPRVQAAPTPTPTPTPTQSPAPSAATARVIESVPAAAAAAAAAASPRLFSGFVLQAGVFTSAARAEELHARLTLSGIPSSIEARVQVGPFKTRQEAAAAQEKLRELGVESLLVPPKGGR